MTQATLLKDDASAAPTSDFPVLHRRDESDPMQLLPQVRKKLQSYFRQRDLAPLPGQMEQLMQAAEAILEGKPGKIVAVPFRPGFGKSTLIRAILEVLAQEFSASTPISETIGGVIVVVEKTSEGEELEHLCNDLTGQQVAVSIASANDYTLGQGRCFNGTAHSFKECPRRSCPDYSQCPLMHAMRHIDHTPILILLHARYQRFMEDMSPFLVWHNDVRDQRRTLLLVDEKPEMIDTQALDTQKLNTLDSELTQLYPSHNPHFSSLKEHVHIRLSSEVIGPYNRLRKLIRQKCSQEHDYYGIITWQDLSQAGFDPQELECLRQALVDYLPSDEHPALDIVDLLLNQQTFFYAIGNDIQLFLPRLRQPDGRLATFLFSGTISLSPELTRNPSVIVLPDRSQVSFGRLTIHLQHSKFSYSREGFQSENNRAAFLAWLRELLPGLRPRKVLLVTYKKWAGYFWEKLSDFHDILIPYTGSDGTAQNMLPYFGGMNGSNLYRESSCVICLGLNRYDPVAYISKALALDPGQTILRQVQQGGLPLSKASQVEEIQHLTLAQDLVQLFLRSSLRNYSETTPVDLWLLEAPDEVALLLLNYFGDCQFQEYPALPQQSEVAAVIAKQRKGKQTSAGKLLEFLISWDGKGGITPTEIQQAAGISQSQFKEARKHPVVRAYSAKHLVRIGSGINTIYYKGGEKNGI